jgi:hypothetical protein
MPSIPIQESDFIVGNRALSEEFLQQGFSLFRVRVKFEDLAPNEFLRLPTR